VVRLKVTGKLNETPAAREPLGRELFDAWYAAIPNSNPIRPLRAIFVVQVTFCVEKDPMLTLPKSSGVLQDNGRATGDPKAKILPTLVDT
jgi:hypothetical protein